MLIDQKELFTGVGAQSVSQREFAEIIGKSEALVRKYLKLGKLTSEAVIVNPKGTNRLNLEVALQQWRAFHPAEESEAQAAPLGEGNLTELQAASLRRALAQAEKEELEVAILKGTHIHIDEIRDVFGPMISNAKGKLYQIEDRLVARLPGNPVETGRIIRQVIDEICSELVYVDPKPAKRRGRKAVAQTAQ